jgi:PAS domain S-box-containing protein
MKSKDMLYFESLCSHIKDLSVLIVDDSKLLQKITFDKLSPYVNTIFVADDGKKGWELVKTYFKEYGKYIDIIITDLEMPYMDGKELSELVLQFNPQQEIIVVSGYGNFERLIELINIGVHKFLNKPTQDSEFYDVLIKVCESLHQRQIEHEAMEESDRINMTMKLQEKRYIKHLEELNVAIRESSILSRTNPTGIITYVNDAFCTLSGYPSEEIIGKTHKLFYSGALDEKFYQELLNTIYSKMIFKGIMQNKTKNGQIYYFSVTITPILDLESNITEFITIGHDITELVKSMEAVKIEKNLKIDFLRNINHELKTPLNSMIGLMPILKKRCMEDEKNLKIITAIEECTMKLHDLITTISEYNAVDKKMLDRTMKSFIPETALCPLLEKVTKKAAIKSQNFSFRFDASTNRTFLGEFDMLNSLLNILLENAFKFTPNFGHISLNISLAVDYRHLEIYVKDNGIGIDPSYHHTIFDLQQVNGDLNRSFEGIGLGLTLAKSIINLIDGSIEVESTLGNGALFKIRFPIHIQ